MKKKYLKRGINVYSDSSESYLNSTEIETIMSLLKIINNPMQDIALITVLRSSIADFTDNQLIEISFVDNKKTFYEKMIQYIENNNNELSNKINDFLKKLENWRKLEEYKTLDEIIWQIYVDTGYMNYVSLMPNGKLKVSNLKMLFEKAKQYESLSFKGLYNFINFIEKVKMSSKDTGAAKIIGENENVVRIMSIHKSKGLEFPVVILAGTGKKVNLQDLNEKLLMHQTLGFGPTYIDAARHIEFKTIAKKAISIVQKNEIISEEMRVLYVALTRAKEKLIITGVQRDVNKSIEEKENQLVAYKNNIGPFLVQKYKTFLDWIELVYAKEKKLINLNIISKNQILNNCKDENLKEDILDKIMQNADNLKDDRFQEDIKKIMEWKYEHIEMSKVPNKTSVTKLKELNLESNVEEEIEKIVLTDKPKVLSNDGDKITGAEKGTLMHLCIQKMDEKKDYNQNEIKELIEGLVQKDIITAIQAENIDITKLLKYVDSPLWQELKEAKEIHKEEPFYINIPVNEIYDIKNKEENILVQGIIDLYYINKNDKLILVDFKTDFIHNENELINKYIKQLLLYKKALENSLNKKVDKMGFYSLYLNKFIEI